MSEPISRIVVIGGGQAAGWACKTLREEGFGGTITVVADEPHDFYERPPLSKAVLSGDASLPRLFPEDDVAGWSIDWRRPKRATHIDSHAHTVTLDDGERLAYDRLLIATGATPRLPDPRWAEHDDVLTLRSWDDAQRLKRRLADARRVAVVGGGWIGLEVAATARRLGLEVEVFERQAALCARSVGPEVSEALAALHLRENVALRLNCGDVAITPLASGVRITSDAHDTQADLAVVGTGVDFGLELAREAGVATQQGIVVDQAGATSVADIFAAGDVTQHPVLGQCLQSWGYAQNQAIAAARGLLGKVAAYDDPAWLWSDQYGTNIQILGTPCPDTRCVVRQEPQGMSFFYLDAGDRLCQAVTFDQPRHIKLAKRWLAAERVLDPDMLGDSTSNLMRLR
nr:Benzene 1,2-dioxygenase system ferredoxin--NAD(+) reductase subunit [Virgibacillus halodenitrificans]